MSLERLNDLSGRGVHYELDTITSLLNGLGDPHKEVRPTLIGGTNGKGTVVHTLSRILQKGGFRSGSYTSPHVHRVTERIQLEGKEMSEEALAKRVDEVLDEAEANDLEPTYFETLTACAFLTFKDEGIEHPVMEVGVGGRLDATNVVEDTVLSIITNVGHDHMNLLGDTLEKVAKEKAGIIRQDVPLLTGAEGLALRTIWSEAAKNKAPMKVLRSMGLPQAKDMDLEGTTFTIKDRTFETDLIGDHNIVDATTAIHATTLLRQQGLDISDGAEDKALQKARLEGRMHILRAKPAVIVDAAHNPDACRAIRAFIKQMGFERTFLLIGVLSDKDYGEMMRILGPLSSEIFVAEPETDRALNMRALAGEARRYCSRVRTARDRVTALRTMLGVANPMDCIVCTGSFYTAGDIIRLWPEVEV